MTEPASTAARGRPRSLARRTTLLVLGALLAFFAGVVVFSARHFRQSLEEAIGGQQVLLATTAAEDIDAQLGLLASALAANTAAMTVEQLASPEAAAAHLRARVSLRVLFDDGLALHDAAGRLVGTWPPDAGGPWPDLAAPGPAAVRYSRPFASSRAGGQPALVVSAPIAGPGGAPVGWISGRLLAMSGRLLGPYAEKRIGREGYYSITTPDRVVLLHRDRQRLLHDGGPPGVNAAVDRGLGGFEGALRTRTSAGVEMITAVKRIRATGWVLAANYPLDEARAPYEEARRLYLLASAMAAALLLGALWLVLNRLTGPLVQMTREVEQLTAGSATGAITVRGRDEVGALAGAFNRLLAELRASEERFRLAFKTSPEPLTLTRLDDGKVVAVNDGFCQLHGLTEEQVLGHNTVELGLWIHPEERRPLREKIERGETVRGADVRVRGAGGEVRVLAFSASPVTLAGVRYMLALARDVTEERAVQAARDRLAEELRQSEERHRAILRSAPLVQWAIDPDGVFTLSEGAGLEALGLKPGQVVGASAFDVYKDVPDVLADYRRALAGESFVSVNQIGANVFESHWGPLRDAAGAITGVTGIAVDLTARKRAEEQLLQAQKMEAVGRLASGIAHDFNNVLTVVMGGSDFLLAREDLASDLREELEQIRQAGERATALVRQLLAFSRKSSFHPVITDLNAVVAGMEKLLQRAIGEHVVIETRLAPDPWPVRVDTNQLDQVLMNLAVNARDAMPGGGVLRLSVENREEGGRREACLAVADTGTGMAPEVKARLFEPFFTTKKPGRGTGLGLSTAFGIVQQAGGRIAVESEPGKGSCFTLCFPAAERAAEAAGEGTAPPPEAGAGQTVLVVEDDEAVRRSTSRMVREAGYAAVEVASGQAALEAIAGGGVDLVLTDIVMPGMLGSELAERLRAERPRLPVVFVSGYLDRHLHRLPPGASLLVKPFRKDALAAALSRALAQGRAAGAARPGPQ